MYTEILINTISWFISYEDFCSTIFAALKSLFSQNIGAVICNPIGNPLGYNKHENTGYHSNKNI